MIFKCRMWGGDMEVKVKLFTALREGAGQEEVSFRWKQGMTHRDILDELKKMFQPLSPLLECSFVAVNGCYAEPGLVLMPEDEVAVLPPVSGG